MFPNPGAGREPKTQVQALDWGLRGALTIEKYWPGEDFFLWQRSQETNENIRLPFFPRVRIITADFK